MLCSILIPARNRLSKLIDLVESIEMNARKRDYEILVRLDYCDPALKEEIAFLGTMAGTRCLVGPRMGGYRDVQKFYSELNRMAAGDWIFMLNDDAQVEGPWQEELEKVEGNCLVYPEHFTYQGQPHVYADHSPFPIFPNGIFTSDVPLDVNLCGELREGGMTEKILPGVTFHHDRLDDAALIAEHEA